MKKETVLKIVDSCMHEFASDHRNKAKEKASKLYDILSNNEILKKYDIIQCIKLRIESEYRKHKDLDWTRLAAQKIYISFVK